MSEYYNGSGYPGYNANGDSASARAEFEAVGLAFNKLPALMGMGHNIIRVNAAGTGLESVLPSIATTPPPINFPNGGIIDLGFISDLAITRINDLGVL